MVERQGEIPVSTPVVSPQELGPQYDLTHSDNERRATKVSIGASIVAGALAIGAIAYALGHESGSTVEAAGKVPANSAEAGNNCEQLVFDNAAANPTQYGKHSFLPKSGGVDSPRAAAKYVRGLFGTKGPLAGKGDMASLSAVNAAVVNPATTGPAKSTTSSYESDFSLNVTGYSNANGLVAARADCKTAYNTLTQVAGYTAKWAGRNESITVFDPVRATKEQAKGLHVEPNTIIGLKMTKSIATEDLRGVEFKLRGTTKGLNDFTDVLVATNSGNYDGQMIVKGWTEGNGGNPIIFSQEQIAAANPNQENGQLQAGSNRNKNNRTNEGQANTGGSAGPNGTNPEAGPGGTTPSPANGGGKTPGGTTPGGTTPGTTTTTRPPSTTTTTRPPSTTTTTRPPSTTTTTRPKGDPPVCEPNPPYVYCP